MLKRSGFYLLSGLMVMLLGQTDRVMIVTMLDETAVGLYSAAVVCANLTEFAFLAIIDSFRPAILTARKNDIHEFETMLTRLYSIIIYLALLQSIFITILAKPIIHIMYGAAYEASVGILRLLVWYTAFSYVGSVRLIWIYAEGKQHLLCLMNFLGALFNILLNWMLIPRWGVGGAAFASLITQFFTNFVLGWVFPQIRGNNEMIIRGLQLKGK